MSYMDCDQYFTYHPSLLKARHVVMDEEADVEEHEYDAAWELIRKYEQEGCLTLEAIVVLAKRTGISMKLRCQRCTRCEVRSERAFHEALLDDHGALENVTLYGKVK